MLFPSYLSGLSGFLDSDILSLVDYSSPFVSFWAFCLLYPIDPAYHA
jgi:hypothetical protein